MIEKIISCIGAIIIAVMWHSENINNADKHWSEFIGIIIPIIIILANIIMYLIRNVKLLFIYIKYKKLRISMAYLFKIKIKDKYLLVVNSNKNFYQFPGGKYKFYDSSKTSLESLEKTDDDLLPEKEGRENDIAFNINPFKFYNFIKWFDSEKDREIEHNREFVEELLKPNSFPIEVFQNLNFRKIDTIRTPLHHTYIKGKSRYEFLSFDFLEPQFTSEQEKYFQQLYQKGNTDYIKWVTEEEIRALVHLENNQNYSEKEIENNIGPHTLWCIEGKYSKRR